MWRAMVMAGVIAAAGVVCAQEAGTQPASAPATQAAGANGFMSEGELTELFRAGKYSDVLHETGRILNAPAVMGGYDEFHLQLLRAECYLQLRNGKMAAETFKQASRVTRDKGKQTLMLATAMLVQRSTGLKYTAKNTDAEGTPSPPALHPNEWHEAVKIDLLVLGKRTAALKALYTDQWFVTTAAVEQAKRSTTMDGYTKALKDLYDLAIAEEAVVGKEEATQKLRDQAAAEMEATIENALGNMTTSVQKLQEAAAEMISVTVPTSYVGNDGMEHQGTVERQRARGLSEADARMLEGIRATSERVELSTRDYAEQLHADKQVFAKSVTDAAALTKLVSDVLAKNTVYRDSAYVR